MWTKSKIQLKISFRQFKIILFRNEEGNFYRYESDCLNAIMPTVINGKTQLYCEACDTACQFCPRKGHWIKFNVSLNTNCYCDMTTCVDGVSTIGGIDTVRCSGNAIMDGRGKCIDLVEINPNIDEDLEDLFKSDNEKSPENGASDPNGIYTVQCSNGQVMDESSKIILLFLLALCF